MAATDSVYRWLEGAGLQRFYNSFKNQGIDEEKFVNLIVSDYHGLGVIELNDRQTLFKLIQVVKKELENTPSTEMENEIPLNNGSLYPHRKNAAISQSTGNLEVQECESPPSPCVKADSKHRYRRAKKSSSMEDIQKSSLSGSRITVCVRKRPLNPKEKGKGEVDCASTKGDSTFFVTEPRTKVDLTKFMCTHKFYFDLVFDESVDNEQIYVQTCKPMVDFFFEGGKCTCFAYGQTGSGKTYTMMGPEGGNKVQNGLYVLAARDIFRGLKRHPNLIINVSFFEIYGGKFYDLLNGRQRLDLREDAQGAVHTIGLRELKCEDWTQMIEMIQFGNERRSQGVTGANTSSSRSHAILQICAKKENGKSHGKYSFIDLAGSERAADTVGNAQKTRLEGAQINKSLLALKECIRALDQNASHRPFRGSKLTQVLKDSLIGNSRTVMIATVSPTVSAVEHTLNTLRYANRVKEMKEAGSGRNPRHNAYMPHNEESRKKRSKSPSRGNRAMSVSTGSGSLKAPTSRSNHKSPTRTLKSPTSLRYNSSSVNGKFKYSSQSMKTSGIPSRSIPISRSSSAEPPIEKEDGTRSRRDSLRQKAEERQEEMKVIAERTKQLNEDNSQRESHVLDQHRKYIHNTMLKVKQEMELLKKFEAKKIDVNCYIDSLKEILSNKEKSASHLATLIDQFQENLHEAEYLHLKLEQMQMDE